MSTFYFSLCSPDSKLQANEIIAACESYLERECILQEDREKLTLENIRGNLGHCDALIVIIGRNILSNSPAWEQLLNERIRWEIISAINLDILIVPLLLEETRLPDKQQIPGAMKRLLECKLYRLKNISWHEDLHQFLDDIECDLEFKKEVDKKLSLSNRPDYRPAIESDGQAPQSTPFRLGHSKAFGLSRAIDTERFNLEESRREGDRVSEKNALSALALAFTQLQQTRKAIQFFQEQLEIVRELKDTEEECDVLANLGDALAISGNIDQAKSYYEEQLQIAESKEFRRFIASAQNGLGFVHVKQNKIGLAIECYLLALGIYRELDNQDKELELLVGIGLNYRKLEDHQRAIFHLEQALNVSKYVENRREESCILVDLTEANYQLGNFDRAHSLLIQAEEYLNKFEEAYLPSERKRLRVLRDSLIDK